MSDNEKTNFKARELKSVHVDVIGSFVRFVVHKNHANTHNTCNQVGIVAINIIGDAVGKNSADKTDTDLNSVDFNVNPMPGMVRRRPDYISPLDDLTFDMYQDPEVAQIIRKLEAKKQEAVSQERYEFAKKLKIAITDLFKVGETLGKYEIEKRQAISMEDYDKARRKKAQMEDFRLKMYEHLELPKLLESTGSYSEEKHIEDLSDSKVDIPNHVNSNPVERKEVDLQITNNNNIIEEVESDSLQDKKNVTGVKNEKPVINSYVAYEERALPGFRRRQLKGPVSGPDDVKNSRIAANHMNEQDKRQASLPIEIFGLSVVQLAYSKTFSDREEALESVQDQIMSLGVSDIHPSKIMRATTFMAQKGLKDSVLSVFCKALDLLAVLLSNFTVKHKVTKAEMSQSLDKITPDLITKLGDKAQRQRTAAHQFILEMMDYPEISALPTVPLQCCQPLSAQVQPRLAQGQAELVEQLINKVGIDKNSGLTLSSVMPFAVSTLQHPSGPVRETGERIIVGLYREKGREVRRYLPSSDTSARKNMIYRQLFDTFERIDEENQRRRLSLISTISNNENGTLARRRSSLAVLSTPELEDRLEKTCIFCNEKSEDFTSEGLDLHYWKYCPMLIRCTHCKQVVEISGLTDHLLEECSAKNKYSKCRRCQEAIPKRDYDVHVKLRTCNPAKPDKSGNRCPLCHKNISVGDKSWKTHLMGKNGCEHNPRRKQYDKRTVDKMKKSQSADRALTITKPEASHVTRMSRSTTRTFNNATTKWR